MGAFLTGTTLGFPDGTQNYAPTPFSNGAQVWNQGGLTNNRDLTFSSIPDWVKKITIAFNALQLTDNAIIGVQLGDSGGIETSGYNGTFTANTTGSFTSTALSTAFYVQTSGSCCGIATIQKGYASNQWIFSFVGADNVSTGIRYSNGYKTLTDTLTQVRIRAMNSTGSFFSSGSVILYFE